MGLLYRSRIHERYFVEVSAGIILRVLRLEVSVYTMFTLQTSFKPILPKGGRGLVDVTVNNKEDNSEDFCPNYVQEFGLCSCSTTWRAVLACLYRQGVRECEL
jgi:hypothetical protein